MNKDKKGFRKNFSWQIFLLTALCFFIVTLPVECTWNLIAKDPVSPLFTVSALLHRAFEAIIAGFILYFVLVQIKRKNPD